MGVYNRGLRPGGKGHDSLAEEVQRARVGGGGA